MCTQHQSNSAAENESICVSTPADAVYVPNPVVEIPPPPPVTAVIVIVAFVPVAVAVTPVPTKLMDVILVAATLVPSSLIVIPLIPPPPPVGAAGTHDDPLHVNTSFELGDALETLDKLPKF